MSNITRVIDSGGSSVGPVSTLERKGSRNGALVWLIPLVLLVIIAVGASWFVFTLSHGKEIADDAGHLTAMVRDPLALWGDYSARGFSENWGSFPPLFPLLFGLFVLPWLHVLPDFWGFRMGVLSWTIVVLFALWLVMDRIESIKPGQKRLFLVLFALAPSVWGAIALIPQEEIYSSLFVLLLYTMARKGHWRHMIWVFALTALAGKYFLLILAIPAAFLSPKPLKYFLLWTLPAAALLSAHIIYHRILFGLTPVLGHSIDPGSSLSIWALVYNLGLKLSPQFIKIASVVLTACFVSVFAWKARRKIPDSFLIAGALYITLLTISITFPAYVLWVLPLTLVCVARMIKRAERALAVMLIFLWGGAEWGENLFRGVSLALNTERGAGKANLAVLIEGFLGKGFPYFFFQMLCVILVILCGISMLFLLWKSGRRVQAALSE